MTRGGNREGSGRPLISNEPRQGHTLRFTKTTWELMEQKAIKRGFIGKKGKVLIAQYLEKLVKEDKK